MKKETLIKLFANSTLALALVVGMAGCDNAPAPATDSGTTTHGETGSHDEGSHSHDEEAGSTTSEAGSTTGGGTDVPE